MINPQELRIGNCLFCNGKIVQVAAIDPLKTFEDLKCTISFPEYFENGKIFGYHHSWINYFEPIPLTEDILLKLEFKKDDNDYDYDHEDFCSWYEKDFPIIGKLITSSDNQYLFDEETDTLRIKYLHQLQNLIHALTGEELTINL